MNKAEIERRMEEVRRDAERMKLRLVVTWYDEYHNPHSVKLKEGDTIKIRPSK